MMQMLTAGGLTPFTDGVRTADESNSKGYFEAEVVKQLQRKNNWLKDCDGKVVKVVAPLIPYLPQGVNYKIVFMHRNISEILDSQSAMLERLQEEGSDLDHESLAEAFRGQVNSAMYCLAVHQHENFSARYNELLADPAGCVPGLIEFLGRDLDSEAMVAAVNPALRRQRHTGSPGRVTEQQDL